MCFGRVVTTNEVTATLTGVAFYGFGVLAGTPPAGLRSDFAAGAVVGAGVAVAAGATVLLAPVEAGLTGRAGRAALALDDVAVLRFVVDITVVASAGLTASGAATAAAVAASFRPPNCWCTHEQAPGHTGHQSPPVQAVRARRC